MKWYATTEQNLWHETAFSESGSAARTEVHTTGETAQTIDGFGTCFNELGGIALERLSGADRKELLDLLFAPDADGLRLQYCRMPVGASDYASKWYSYNETEGDFGMEHFSIEPDRRYLLPYMKEAYSRNPGITLFASPWSPPTWMKYPQAHNYGTLIQTDENLRAYALYLCRFIEAYENEGIHIDALHVQNEPFSDQKFPSCVWTGDEMINFIGRYLGPAVRARGLDTKIFMGTINSGSFDDYNEYVNAALLDENASKYIDGIGVQWAAKKMIPLISRSWPEIYTLQTENECGDGENSYGYARYVFSLMHHYITNGVRAYVYWNAVLDEGGRSTWGWAQNSMVTVDGNGFTLRPEYFVMKHFSRFVKPGAKRLVLDGHHSSNALAFENTDGGKCTVIQNPFRTPLTVSFSLGEEKHTVTLEPDSINTFAEE